MENAAPRGLILFPERVIVPEENSASIPEGIRESETKSTLAFPDTGVRAISICSDSMRKADSKRIEDLPAGNKSEQKMESPENS